MSRFLAKYFTLCFSLSFQHFCLTEVWISLEFKRLLNVITYSLGINVTIR